jgi:hypothetical protein
MLNKDTKKHSALLLSGMEDGSADGNMIPGAMQSGPGGEEMRVRKLIEGFG